MGEPWDALGRIWEGLGSLWDRPLEKKGSLGGPRKPPEAAWVPHGWLLNKKGVFGGGKTKTPEAAWAAHATGV